VGGGGGGGGGGGRSGAGAAFYVRNPVTTRILTTD